MKTNYILIFGLLFGIFCYFSLVQFYTNRNHSYFGGVKFGSAKAEVDKKIGYLFDEKKNCYLISFDGVDIETRLVFSYDQKLEGMILKTDSVILVDRLQSKIHFDRKKVAIHNIQPKFQILYNQKHDYNAICIYTDKLKYSKYLKRLLDIEEFTDR
ncbi:MAG: hypothetical protein N4A45_09525 [Flavobacteriales bacterium]|jgi:hypothetical protein|nr:hypothetical protein [Flavobacteriales bacterium]